MCPLDKDRGEGSRDRKGGEEGREGAHESTAMVKVAFII
jgi:hypothetical protein